MLPGGMGRQSMAGGGLWEGEMVSGELSIPLEPSPAPDTELAGTGMGLDDVETELHGTETRLDGAGRGLDGVETEGDEMGMERGWTEISVVVASLLSLPLSQPESRSL